MPATRLLPLALLLAAAPGLGAAEDSLRCQGGLVSVGDLKLDLLGKCGEPTLREATRTESIGVVRGVPGERQERHRELAAVERWTYDFGRNQFVEVVTLEGGRVTAIERGSRGYADPPAGARAAPLPRARCDERSLRVGDTSYDVLARCGEPATRDLRLVEQAVEVRSGDAALQRAVVVPVEVWTYHFGPQTLTRVLELVDGKVVRVETGSRGYAP